MIQLTRKVLFAVPDILLTTGAALTAQMNVDYDAGVTIFEFDNNIYAADTVKETLIEIQNYKCAFCEARIGHIDDGDVEHFRPKKGYKQTNGDPLEKPGYYWLGYHWDNLYLACTKCNQRNKGNLFPLLTGSVRAISHHSNLDLELPVFIHPSAEDPSQHITFENEIPTEVNGSIRGKLTIQYLALDRSVLTQDRAERLSDLKTLFELVKLIPLIPEDIRKEALQNLQRQYNEKTSETYPYAGMFRAFFQRYPVPKN